MAAQVTETQSRQSRDVRPDETWKLEIRAMTRHTTWRQTEPRPTLRDMKNHVSRQDTCLETPSLVYALKFWYFFPAVY